MGDSTYEMIYAASGATRVIPPDALAPRGGWCWNELHTSDPKKALAFYEKVFGFAHRSLAGRTSRTTSSRRAASTAAE